MSWIELLQVLGDLGDFLGAIAVVATLLYLATQVRQSKVLMEHQGHLNSADQMTKFMTLAAGSPQVSDLFVRGTRSRQELTEAETFQWDMGVSVHLTALEFHVRSSPDPRTDSDAPAWGEIVKMFLAHPGGRDYWRTHRGKYYPEFVEWVDSEVDLRDPGEA